MYIGGGTVRVVSSQINNNAAGGVRAILLKSYPLPHWNSSSHMIWLDSRLRRMAAGQCARCCLNHSKAPLDSQIAHKSLFPPTLPATPCQSQGGGMYIIGGVVTVEQTTISGNTADYVSAPSLPSFLIHCPNGAYVCNGSTHAVLLDLIRLFVSWCIGREHVLVFRGGCHDYSLRPTGIWCVWLPKLCLRPSSDAALAATYASWRSMRGLVRV